VTDNNQPKGFKYWAKATLLFIGQSLLLCLGLASLIFAFVDFFEGSFSFSEVSTLEILFSLVLISLVGRHVTSSKAVGLKWTSVVYRPLRNIGWFGLAGSLLAVFLILNEVDIEKLSMFAAKNTNRMQWLDLILIQLCFYWAAPKLPVEQPIGDEVVKEEAAQ